VGKKISSIPYISIDDRDIGEFATQV